MNFVVSQRKCKVYLYLSHLALLLWLDLLFLFFPATWRIIYLIRFLKTLIFFPLFFRVSLFVCFDFHILLYLNKTSAFCLGSIPSYCVNNKVRWLWHTVSSFPSSFNNFRYCLFWGIPSNVFKKDTLCIFQVLLLFG